MTLVAGIDEMIYHQLEDRIIDHAEKHGIAAAEVFVDSISRLDMTPETCHDILLAVEKMEGIDNLPIPNLSGEWADDPTPDSLRQDIRAELGDWVWACDDLMEEWEISVEVAYLTTLEQILRAHLEKVGW